MREWDKVRLRSRHVTCSALAWLGSGWLRWPASAGSGHKDTETSRFATNLGWSAQQMIISVATIPKTNNKPPGKECLGLVMS